MAACTECGKSAGLWMSVCPACIEQGEKASRQMAQDQMSAKSSGVSSAKKTPVEIGNGDLCILLGVVFLAIGGWFLVGNPSADDAEGYARTVVNLQKLTIGETSSIVGAIFLAAGIRPRR